MVNSYLFDNKGNKPCLWVVSIGTNPVRGFDNRNGGGKQMKKHNAREGLVKQSSAHNTRIKALCAVMGLAAASMIPAAALAGGTTTTTGGSGEVTLIQTGDIHGHLVPRPNLRSDAIGYRGVSMEGGAVS